jgi:hypothetical protein
MVCPKCAFHLQCIATIQQSSIITWVLDCLSQEQPPRALFLTQA